MMGRPTTGGGACQVMRSAAVLVMVVVVMTTAMAPSVVRAVTCGQVLGYMTPCVSYAMGTGTTNPPEACCSGVRSLNAAANNTTERQATCKCLKKITATMPLLNPDTVAGIPAKCGVDIPYPIRSSTDCSKVQ